jgi:hypothetical protein
MKLTTIEEWRRKINESGEDQPNLISLKKFKMLQEGLIKAFMGLGEVIKNYCS